MGNPTNFDAVHNAYTHGANIAKPAASATADTNARVALGSLLDALRAAGILGLGALSRTATCVTTISTTGCTSTDANFTSSDVGATITGTGLSGGTTIQSVTNSTTIVLSQNAASSQNPTTLKSGNAAATARPAASSVYDATAKCYVHAAAIADVTGGATIDTQLRTAVNQCLAAARGGGLIVGNTAGPANWDEDTLSWTFSQYTSPSGGATVDSAARTTVDSIATVLKSAGLLAQD